MFSSESSEVYVSRVMQKVFLEINEDGSEAATSTGKTNDFLRNDKDGGQGGGLGLFCPIRTFLLSSAV